MFWARLKTKVAKMNTTRKLADVVALLEQYIGVFGNDREFLEGICRHVEGVEEEFRKRDGDYNSVGEANAILIDLDDVDPEDDDDEAWVHMLFSADADNAADEQPVPLYDEDSDDEGSIEL